MHPIDISSHKGSLNWHFEPYIITTPACRRTPDPVWAMLDLPVVKILVGQALVMLPRETLFETIMKPQR